MSSYSNMTASPFWKGVMRVTGILCIVTLMLPTLYYLKYVIVDYPAEVAVANTIPVADVFEHAVTVRNVRKYIHVAVKGTTPKDRIWGLDRLADVLKLPNAQIFHPMECLNAKLSISHVAQTDPDVTVKAHALAVYAKVAQGGVVVDR